MIESALGPARGGHQPLVVIFVVALLLRLWNVAALADTPLYSTFHGDGRAYVEWADAIRSGGFAGLFASAEPFYQAPLYPHVLAVVRTLLGEAPVTIRILQAVLGATSALLLALATRGALARATSPGLAARAGVVAGGLLAVLPVSIWLDGLVQKSCVATFLLTLAMWLSTHHSGRAMWSLGVVVGLLMLTRGEARLFALVFGVFVLRRAERRPVFLYVAGLALAVAPALARNVVASGEWVLTTAQSGPNFYIGNRADADGTYAPLVPGRGDAKFEREDARRLAEAHAGRELSGKDVSAHWRVRALEEMNADRPAAFLRFGRKALLALSHHELADTDDLRHAARASIPLRLPVGFPVVFGLVALGAVLATRHERCTLAPFAAIAAAQFAALIVFYVFARYRMPLTVALLPFAGLAAAAAMRVRMRKLTTLLVLVASITLTFLVPYDATRGEAAALVTEGVILADERRHPEARERAGEALERAPDLFDAHRLLALTHMREERGDLALPSLEVAHRISPQDWQVRTWLGIALHESGASERAQPLLTGAALERPAAFPIVSNAIALSTMLGAHRDAIEVARARLASDDADTATDVPIRLQLGWLLATSTDDGVRDGEAALDVIEGLSGAVDVRAAALAELGRFDEALRVLEAQPTTRATQDAIARYRRGEPTRTRAR